MQLPLHTASDAPHCPEPPPVPGRLLEESPCAQPDAARAPASPTMTIPKYLKKLISKWYQTVDDSETVRQGAQEADIGTTRSFQP